MAQFDLTFEEELEIDKELDELEGNEEENIPEGWTHLSLAVPQSFLDLFQRTLTAYKTLTETDKTFPAFEAMVMEAFNSLPDEIREVIGEMK